MPINPMVRAKGLSVGEHRIADRLESLLGNAEDTEQAKHTFVVDRWSGWTQEPSQLLKACEWAGKEAEAGYTELSFQVDEKVLIFTASKPES